MAFNLDKNDGPAKSKFDLSKSDPSTPDFSEPKKNNKIIWIILAIVVVGVVVYFITNNSSKEPEPGMVASDTTQTTENTTAATVTDSAGSSATATVSAVAPPANYTPAQFSKGSAAVGSVDENKINQILDYLKANPSAVINVEGYASSEGELDFNQKLSSSRASNFADYLISKGVKPENLKVTGKGIENPIASNDDESGRSQNRRVEIKF